MKTLDEIKKLMAAGETDKADEALKELLAKEPDNLQSKILYGTCRQLLGDVVIVCNHFLRRLPNSVGRHILKKNDSRQFRWMKI